MFIVIFKTTLLILNLIKHCKKYAYTTDPIQWPTAAMHRDADGNRTGPREIPIKMRVAQSDATPNMASCMLVWPRLKF